MKLLFDQGTPVPLRKYLLSHTVVTAYEQGWNDIRNGDLLQRAETADFDAIITTDQNIRYQQNLTGRKISIVVLLTTKSEQTRLRHFFQNRMNKIFGRIYRIANSNKAFVRFESCSSCKESCPSCLKVFCFDLAGHESRNTLLWL